MRLFCTLLLALVVSTTMAHAQEDSIFPNYEAYDAYVDQKIKSRDFTPLILRLGGRDEMTKEQLAGTTNQLLQVWPADFQHGIVFRSEDLGNGISQEGRMYWTGLQYAYYYAILHQRENDFVVLSFRLNTSIDKIMGRF
jgi:hypothetical protein